MTLIDLSADDVLNTTRAVRKRLDFTRPVDDELIRECVATAMQAPSGWNSITMQFVVVKDEAKRRAIGEIYAQCFEIYRQMPFYAGAIVILFLFVIMLLGVDKAEEWQLREPVAGQRPLA